MDRADSGEVASAQLTPEMSRDRSEPPSKKARVSTPAAGSKGDGDSLEGGRAGTDLLTPGDDEPSRLEVMEKDYQWGKVFKLLVQSFKTMSHERVSHEKSIREARDKSQRDSDTVERRLKDADARCGELSLKLETSEREVTILRRQLDDERREKAQAWEELSRAQRSLQTETDKVHDCQRQIHVMRGMLNSDIPKSDMDLSLLPDDVRSSILQQQQAQQQQAQQQGSSQSPAQQQAQHLPIYQHDPQAQQAQQQGQPQQYMHYGNIPPPHMPPPMPAMQQHAQHHQMHHPQQQQQQQQHLHHHYPTHAPQGPYDGHVM
eukprot:TRINITY_DN3591_c1_g1_i1.p1 TRINITY_DN3591_c1_g1~~TRINITY_DN3591_c1_g1_i1.p1  ORF type:complete len:336 (+),score=97.75 TRINITY_DN3591_c1_g1_i1:55-1008(+)